MRIRNVALLLIGGFMLGTCCTLYTRAEEKSVGSPKKDWSHVQVVTYASGLTGFFDPATGKFYVYDSSWKNCVFIGELTELGDPMKAVKSWQ